jgi:hypothetical protein
MATDDGRPALRPVAADHRWAKLLTVPQTSQAPQTIGLQDHRVTVPEPARALLAIMREAQRAGAFVGPGSHLHHALGEMLAAAYLAQTS